MHILRTGLDRLAGNAALIAEAALMRAPVMGNKKRDVRVLQ